MVRHPVSYWLVRLGSNIRGPYDKTADLKEAARVAFGIIGGPYTNLAFKSLGTRVAPIRTAKYHTNYPAIVTANTGWVDVNGDPITEETVAKMPTGGVGWPIKE